MELPSSAPAPQPPTIAHNGAPDPAARRRAVRRDDDLSRTSTGRSTRRRHAAVLDGPSGGFRSRAGGGNRCAGDRRDVPAGGPQAPRGRRLVHRPGFHPARLLFRAGDDPRRLPFLPRRPGSGADGGPARPQPVGKPAFLRPERPQPRHAPQEPGKTQLDQQYRSGDGHGGVAAQSDHPARQEAAPGRPRSRAAARGPRNRIREGRRLQSGALSLSVAGADPEAAQRLAERGLPADGPVFRPEMGTKRRRGAAADDPGTDREGARRTAFSSAARRIITRRRRGRPILWSGPRTRTPRPTRPSKS